MKSAIEETDRATIIHLEGRITVGSDMAALRDVFTDAGVDEGARLVIDLERVNFVDSAGLGELVACHRRSLASGGSMCLAAARGRVADLLELTRVGELVPIAESVDGAIDADH